MGNSDITHLSELIKFIWPQVPVMRFDYNGSRIVLQYKTI